jgi:hypothetical protein
MCFKFFHLLWGVLFCKLSNAKVLVFLQVINCQGHPHRRNSCLLIQKIIILSIDFFARLLYIDSTPLPGSMFGSCLDRMTRLAPEPF